MLYQVVRSRQGKLGVGKACLALGVSKSGYGAWVSAKPSQPPPVLEEIREIVAEFNGYGFRRVTVELKHRKFEVNHKRVLSLMRENGLLCHRKKFNVNTTDSNHGLPVYPNLAGEFKPTGLNQLWVADITYVQLPRGFCYLAVVIDVYSRRVIGWQLSRSIDAKLCLDALRKALDCRAESSIEGLIHHSDQGVQYASKDYVDALLARSVRVSMSRKGNPYDNAFAESFMKTFKVEEVYVNEYESFEEALKNIGKFIGMIYNKKRLHSSLGYLPPEEYEQQLLMGARD